MAEYIIDNFIDLHNAIEKLGMGDCIYRGERNLDNELKPKLGRINRGDPEENIYTFEEYILKYFKIGAKPFIKIQPENEWDWLSLAQHHGLPTRLLDWSKNPLVAAYFAVEEKHNADSVIYAYDYEYIADIDHQPEPFNIKEVIVFLPVHLTQRITVQNGIFTVHPNPEQTFTNNKIHKIIIKKKFRSKLKILLNCYGTNRASLFPDLDGLAKHLQWKNTKSH